MYRANIYGGRRGAGLHAISGIDMALWTSKAKRSDCLSGSCWRRLPPEDPLLRQLAVRPDAGEDGRTGAPLSRQGFTAVKFGWIPWAG